jgi:hypothetical protein
MPPSHQLGLDLATTEGQDSYRLAQATAGQGQAAGLNTALPALMVGFLAPAGRKDGHRWGILWPPLERNRWPLTLMPRVSALYCVQDRT